MQRVLSLSFLFVASATFATTSANAQCSSCGTVVDSGSYAPVYNSAPDYSPAPSYYLPSQPAYAYAQQPMSAYSQACSSCPPSAGRQFGPPIVQRFSPVTYAQGTTDNYGNYSRHTINFNGPGRLLFGILRDR